MSNPPTAGQLADAIRSYYALMPAGPAGNFPGSNSHGFGIPAGAKNKEAAWEFIKWAMSKDTLRRIALDWRLSETDYHTMRVAAASFGAHIAEQSIGRLRVADWLLAEDPQVPPWPEEETGGHHHLCTTRMSDDPKRGVVDRNCRVHGVPNLYLGGSSVFATAAGRYLGAEVKGERGATSLQLGSSWNTVPRRRSRAKVKNAN